ncbi:DUF3310 domain-containing protein [Ruminococcus callidus]|uniref:DUF3310 domain-containing protein n=1 Tax=Ruminococcus callidus TaxID=40519 RepID=UPI0035202720
MNKLKRRPFCGSRAGYEVEAVKNFCICNAFKYLWRHGKKNGVEDVKKAAWYLNKFIELEEKEK